MQNVRSTKVTATSLKRLREGSDMSGPSEGKKQDTHDQVKPGSGVSIRLAKPADEAELDQITKLMNTAFAEFHKSTTVTMAEDKPKPYSSKLTSSGLVLAVPTRERSTMPVWESLILALAQVLHEKITIAVADPSATVPELVLSDIDKAYLSGITDAVVNLDDPQLRVIRSGSVSQLTHAAINWLAAIRLVEDKENRGEIQPIAIPVNPVNGGAPGAYLEARHNAFKQALGANAWIADTIHALAKLLAEGMAENTRPSILKLRVPWAAVLKEARLTRYEKIKPKKGPIRVLMQINLPVNPAKSGYLLINERTHMGHIMATKWGRIEEFRKRWASASPVETHIQFAGMVKQLIDLSADLKTVADTVGRRIGHRKRYIDELIKDKNIKVKKDAAAPDRTAAATAKLEHITSLKQEVKWIFSPFYAFGEKDQMLEEIRNSINGKTVNEATNLVSVGDTDDVRLSKLKLVKNWLINFKPDLKNITANPTPAEQRPKSQANPFGVLDEDVGNPEIEMSE